MSDTERILGTFARQGHGVVRLTQLVEAGVDEVEIRRRIRRGSLIRVAGGVFVVNGSVPTLRQRLTMATSTAGEAVASHESAAELHRFRYAPRGLVVVTIAATQQVRSIPADRVHRYKDLRPEFCTSADGIPVTTPERTMIDLAAKLRPERLARVLDDRLASGALDIRRLIAVFNALARRGRHGIGRIRPLLEVRGEGHVFSTTELEARFDRLIARFGLPRPDCQVLPPWAVQDGIGRVDFAYRSQHLIVELDGRRWHSYDQARETDTHRDQVAAAHGWRVMRCTWRQIVKTPGEVAGLLRAALAAAA